MLSSLLIKETFDEFNLDNKQNQNTSKNLFSQNTKININTYSNSIPISNFNPNTKSFYTFNLYGLSEDIIKKYIIKKEIIYEDQKQNNNFIENIEEKNYYLQDNEVKYKIFEDISSISKINNDIELILNIPIENNIISINKIKLSNRLNKYIKNIYLNIDEKIIITKDEIIGNKENLLKIIERKQKENSINNLSNKNINIHIILDKNALNHIINKNIFVNYSYAIFKNKVKFL
jgi:hypothetical protein